MKPAEAQVRREFRASRSGESPAKAETADNARQRLLELRRRQQDLASVDKAIVPRSAAAAIPLSVAQQGLWFLDRLTGHNAVYSIVRAVRLRGQLDIAALDLAIRGLVTRHESLRTGFEARDGLAVQVIQPAEIAAANLRLEIQCAVGKLAVEREQSLDKWLQAGAAEPFDLASPPLLRARLLRLSEQEHALLLAVHHIVADGWSLDILARELDVLYTAFCAGLSDSLPALPIQFGDYALWHRQRQNGPANQRDLAFWRQQLQALEPLRLPTDRPRPPRPSYRGAHYQFALPMALLVNLKALARRENVTLYMLLLAAFQVFLMRWSGQRDVVVGSPVAGRSRTELEGLMGYFVNTLVLRSDLAGSPSFIELLGRVRKVCLDAYAHQELHFDQLVADLSPQRDLSRNPLYQVSFALQNMPASAFTLGGLQALPLAVRSATAKFDLSLTLTEDASALVGLFEYSTDLFDADTIGRMARHFQNLLQAVAADPRQAITWLPLLDQHERAQLLARWNDTARSYPQHLNLHQLFEIQVERNPAAIAVIFDDEELSYGELNGRANRLAHHLRILGVGPDVLVGLCLQRGPAVMVALLAIMKAGGAYVPLDPQYPGERLAFMLDDTGAAVVLTEQALLPRLPDTSATILCMDRDAQLFATCPETNPEVLATPDHLAYVIYTSGSTGLPKGVAMAQRAVINHNFWLEQQLGLGIDDRVVQAASISFDASVWELFGPLGVGAAVVLVREGRRGDTGYMCQLIRQHRVTVMQAVPSELSVLIEETAFADCDSLRYMLSGGEALEPTLARRFLERLPTATLANCYGPTEACIDTTYCEVGEVPAGTTSLPIGKPLANARCHILDAELQPVPIGIVGELYIGGAGLARGYLNQPALTAEHFIADPFRQGERLYRTGDLARYLADGAIAYAGRIDQQVKLRGFRIELGEIEAALEAWDGIRQSVVLLREDQPGLKRLVAYVASNSTVNVPALTQHVRQRLPGHMVPTAIVSLPALPLTLSGKLDRRALPVPEIGSTGHNFVAPSSATELALAQIWQEMLGAERISVHDSFFDLGGHSLLAIRLLDAVHKGFDRALDLASLFEAPTIHAQAQLLNQTQQAAAISTCAIAIQASGDRPPLFFVSGYGGQLLPFHSLAGELDANQPLYVLNLHSLRDFDSSVSNGDTVTVEAIAMQMVEDMRRIQPRGPYYLAGFSLGGKIVYEIAQQLYRAGERAELLALLDCGAPGYPRSSSFLARTALHVRHALSFGPMGTLKYLFDRVKNLRKYVGFAEHLEPRVFKPEDDIDHSAALVEAIEARAKLILEAWRNYVAVSYPGQMTLIRAGVRDHQPGVHDDDLLMGWGDLVGGGIDIATLQCRHVEMIDPPHSPALAALLTARLSSFREAAAFSRG